MNILHIFVHGRSILHRNNICVLPAILKITSGKSFQMLAISFRALSWSTEYIFFSQLVTSRVSREFSYWKRRYLRFTTEIIPTSISWRREVEFWGRNDTVTFSKVGMFSSFLWLLEWSRWEGEPFYQAYKQWMKKTLRGIRIKFRMSSRPFCWIWSRTQFSHLSCLYSTVVDGHVQFSWEGSGLYLFHSHTPDMLAWYSPSYVHST